MSDLPRVLAPLERGVVVVPLEVLATAAGDVVAFDAATGVFLGSVFLGSGAFFFIPDVELEGIGSESVATLLLLRARSALLGPFGELFTIVKVLFPYILL